MAAPPLLRLSHRARMGLFVFSDIGRFFSPSGDLVPGGADPYLKADWDRHTARAVSDPIASDQPLKLVDLTRFPSRRVIPPGLKTL